MWRDCRHLSGHANGAKLPQSRSVDKGVVQIKTIDFQKHVVVVLCCHSRRTHNRRLNYR